MTDKQQQQQNYVDEFAERLAELPTNMRFFSLALRSLCNENTLRSSSPAAVKVKELLDATIGDARVYVKGVLPFSTLVVGSIQSYLEYYSELTFEEWKENLDHVVEQVRGYKQCCEVVLRLHEEVMRSMKKTGDKAKVLLAEFSDLTQEYERRKKEYEKSAGKKRSLGVALSFVPGINLIARPLLGKGADRDMMAALEEESKLTVAIILIVSKTLIPALDEFFRGLNAAVYFFSVTENQMKHFQERAEVPILKAKKQHYVIMKKKAHEIQSSCREFYVTLSRVRTDLQCLPEKPADQKYIDDWLLNQKGKFVREYKSGITSGLQNMVKLFTSKDAEHLMIKNI